MTTIAYREGVLAADSRAMNGGWKQPGGVRKLRRISNGSICGGTGDLTKCIAVIDWLDGNRSAPMPDHGDDWRVIELTAEGRLLVYEKGGMFEPVVEFCAWGSGAPAANAAMIMGADAVKAVEVAAQVDPYTGGAVVFMKHAAD